MSVGSFPEQRLVIEPNVNVALVRIKLSRICCKLYNPPESFVLRFWKGRHILLGKVRVTIWRVRVRVIWVTIWYLTMNYLPNGKLTLTSSPGSSRYSKRRTEAKILGDAAKPSTNRGVFVS